MTIPAILGHGVFLLASLLAGFARPGSRHRSETRRHGRANAVEPERLPDSASLAGVPLRILLSDRSGPGGLLKDTLMTRPPPHEK